MTLTVGSLCAGAGMLDLALASRLDVRQAWHAEVDPAASKVLAAHWPDAPNHGDITATDWTMVEPIDVLCGGIPCQSWSLAGLRKGSLDERDLWPVRKADEDGQPRRGALDAIRVLRPRLFVLENVPGLLTAEAGVPFGTILADLDELGYAASWTIVGACRVGACHHRHRLFLAAVPAELVADTDRLSVPPSSWRTPTGWTSTAGTLFGDGGPVVWSQAGMVVDGHAWPLPADPCGATVPVLPTPTATPYGNNQSPSAGAAVRPSLEGAVRMLPTPRVSAVRTSRTAITEHSSSPSLEQALEIVDGVLPRELTSWDEAPASWVPLPTPTAHCEPNQRGLPSPETAARRLFEEGRRNLEDAVALLPTPTARDASRGSGKQEPAGRPLSEVIALLPTPVATDVHGGPGRRNTHGKPMLPGAVGHLAPASDARGVGALLPTPRASDAAKGGPNQRGSSGDLMLPAAVQPGRFGMYEAAVRRQEAAFGLPAPEPTEPGRLGKPRLAAAFPEWMVGLARGWITDHVSRNEAIKIAGNGVVWQSCAYALPLLPTFRAFVRAVAGSAVAR